MESFDTGIVEMLRKFQYWACRAAERIQRPWGKEEDEAPLRAKRAENFYGLELYYGRLLLVYPMKPPIP